MSIEYPCISARLDSPSPVYFMLIRKVAGQAATRRQGAVYAVRGVARGVAGVALQRASGAGGDGAAAAYCAAPRSGCRRWAERHCGLRWPRQSRDSAATQRRESKRRLIKHFPNKRERAGVTMRRWLIRNSRCATRGHAAPRRLAGLASPAAAHGSRAARRAKGTGQLIDGQAVQVADAPPHEYQFLRGWCTCPACARPAPTRLASSHTHSSRPGLCQRAAAGVKAVT